MKKEHFEVLLEDMNSKFDVMMEFVKDIPDIKIRVTTIESDVSGLKADMQIVKGVLREHSADIKELKAMAHAHD